MDAERFDRLAMRLGGGGSRRGLLGGASRRRLLQRLSALPLGVGFASLVAAADAKKGKGKGNGGNGKNDDDNEVAADKNRAKRRKKQCRRKKAKACNGRCGTVTVKCKKRNGKTKRTQVDCGSCACDPPCGPCATCTAARRCEPCEPCCEEVCCDQANAVCHAETGACCDPASKAQTCDGRCGEVTNNCGFPVDCGPCTCGGGCPRCQVCDEHAGDCIPDPGQAGDPCGEPGQVCQDNGSCACEAGTCPDCTTCANDGACVGCADCCDSNGACQDGERNTACGSSGICEVCTGQEECQGQQCVCVPDCDGKVCGPDGCGDQCGPGCGANETCEGGRCVCQGCRSRINNQCEVGDAWAQCGADGDLCADCARGEVCAAGSQTCGDCESGFRQRGTFCEIRNDFAKFQCAPHCACGAHVGGGPGVCWNVSDIAYCSSSQPICEFAADCVIEGLGDFCVPLGDCETGCIQTACVTRCGTGADDGPPRLVVLD